MATIAQIKQEIIQLQDSEADELFAWLSERIMEDDDWDRQMKADAAAGKFNGFRQEIRKAREAGELRDMPF